MDRVDMIAGVGIGLAVGVLATVILRAGSRWALSRRRGGTLILAGSNAIRYALMAAAVYLTRTLGSPAMAILALGVMGAATLLGAFLVRSACRARPEIRTPPGAAI